MGVALRADLTTSWLLRSLFGSLLIPLIGAFLVGVFWEAFPPHGLSLVYGTGWILATLALWIYVMRSPLKIYLNKRKGALEVRAEGVHINGSLIPFSAIEATQLGTSPLVTPDYQSVLRWKRPRFVNGSVMGPRLYLWLKREMELPSTDKTNIFLLCPSSLLWGALPARCIILETLTFSLPLRTIQEEVDKHLLNSREPRMPSVTQ